MACVSVEVPYAASTISVKFPSEDVSCKLAKEIVSRAVGDDHPPGELYISTNGVLSIPEPEEALSSYEVFTEKSSLIFKPCTETVTVFFAKQFVIDKDMTMKDLMSSLQHEFPCSIETTHIYMSKKPPDAVTIGSLIPNEELFQSNIKKLRPSTTLAKQTNNQGVGSNFLFLRESSIHPSPLPSPKDISLPIPKSESPRRRSRNRTILSHSVAETSLNKDDNVLLRKPKNLAKDRVKSLPKSAAITLRNRTETMFNIDTGTRASPRSEDTSTPKSDRSEKKKILPSFMRLSRGKSIDSLPRGILSSASNFLESSERKVDPAIGFFGVALEDVLQRETEVNNNIPSIVEQMFEFLEANDAHKHEGIFRVCANQTEINELLDQFDSGKPVSLENYSVHVIANCLKYYFQILPDPVLTIELHERFIAAILIEDKNLQISYFNCLISSLPKGHYEICKRLAEYFKKIAYFKTFNKMDLKNVGIILGPLIWRAKDTEEYYQNFLQYSKYTVEIGKIIVEHAATLFIPTTPLHCFLSNKRYIVDAELIVDNSQFVYVFKKDKDDWHAEYNMQYIKIPLVYGEDSTHQHVMLRGHTTISQLQKIDPTHENALKSLRRSSTNFLSPRNFFSRK